MNEERKQLKQFLENNIPFKELKKVGFFGKDIKRTDYEKIAEIICFHFGFKSIYEYKRPHISQETPTVVNGKFPDEIDKDGNFIVGGGFHIDYAETAFTCPICECKQDATQSKAYNNSPLPVVIIKCKGCKRKLRLYNDQGGNLTVTEVSDKK